MKVLILDIDGVLIPFPVLRNCGWKLKPELVARLRKFVERHDASIVISAGCRQNDFPNRTLRMFAEAGWDSPPIIGRTPKLDYRGEEILQWLSENPNVESYIILDDEIYSLVHPLTNIVQTNRFIGVSDKEIEKMDEIWKIS